MPPLINNIDDFIQGIGVITDTMMVFYQSCLKSGFNEDQANYFTGEFIRQLIQNAAMNQNPQSGD